MRKIEILQINKLYSPWIGGVESVVKQIAEGLSNRVDMNVLVCNTENKYLEENVNGVNITRSKSIGRFFSMPISISFINDFREKSLGKDILHFHMPFPLADLAYLITKPKNKIVIWWHSDIVRQSWFLPVHKFILDKLLSSASRIIVATHNHITSSRFLPKFKDKCEVIPFGIDLIKYEPTEKMNKIINDIKTKNAERLILFVGRLVYYKGIDYLIRAMNNIEATLVIIGTGPMENELKKYVNESNMNKKIIFLGNVSDLDMKAYFHACNIFVLPSVENSEAFGLVQLEAMACGKPVINTTLPTGVSYVSKNEETGLSVPPKDEKALANAINRLLNNDQERKKFGDNARKRVKDLFTIEKMLADILRLYEKVMME